MMRRLSYRSASTPASATPPELAGGQVDGDPICPRGELAVTAEPVEIRQHLDERLLRPVLGELPQLVEVERGEVAAVVPVEVAGRDVRRVAGHREVHGRQEIPGVQRVLVEDPDRRQRRRAAKARQRDVRGAVAVQVGDDGIVAMDVRRQLQRRLEPAALHGVLPQQPRAVGSCVDDHDVRRAVAVEVRDGEVPGIGADDGDDRRGEGAGLGLPVVEKPSLAVGLAGRELLERQDVLPAVAVEIDDGDIGIDGQGIEPVLGIAAVAAASAAGAQR